MSARLMDGASKCFFSQFHFQPTNIYNHQEHINNMTVNYSNDKGEEKKQEEVETPEPGTLWVEGKEEDAGNACGWQSSQACVVSRQGQLR